MFYALTLSKDSNGTWLVDVPALPHVHTFGETKADARKRALDAVVTGLEILADSRAPIPAPLVVAPRGDTVRVSSLVAAEIEFHNAMLGSSRRR
jgi:antitoxin HicB